MNNDICWDKMISASSIRNYLLKDTFLFEYILNSITILFFVIFFTKSFKKK